MSSENHDESENEWLHRILEMSPQDILHTISYANHDQLSLFCTLCGEENHSYDNQKIEYQHLVEIDNSTCSRPNSTRCQNAMKKLELSYKWDDSDQHIVPVHLRKLKI